MKKTLAVILCMLVIFASCQKAEAESRTLNDSFGIFPIVDWGILPLPTLATEVESIPEPEILTFGMPQIPGVINDTQVRLRSAPNLESEVLGFLNTGDKVIIFERTTKEQQVDIMKNYWYKVQQEDSSEGWVYGAFIDFVDYEIIWVEPKIENEIRRILGKNAGIIMKSDLDSIRKLILKGFDISKIDDLAHFKNLTVLDLTENLYIKDISILFVLTNLTELSLGGDSDAYHSNISDIKPLSALTNLTFLNLKYINLSNLSPLTSLTKLTELDLSKNDQIYDIRHLSSLSNLTELNLSYNNSVRDITSLGNLTNLTKLNLEDNDISNVGTLASLSNLTYLNLNWNDINDISVLANLSNLTYLGLTGNNIDDIRVLAELKHLKELSLYNNRITDWSPVAHIFGADDVIFWKEKSIEDAIRKKLNKPEGFIMPNDLDQITTLDLYYFDIYETDDFAHFKNLASLKVNFGNIYARRSRSGDLRGLSGLTNLTQLSLRGYAISNLSPLSGLTNLTKLSLEGHSISDLRPLSGLTNLTQLSLESYVLSDLNPLSGLINLIELDIYNAQSGHGEMALGNIKDIWPLSTLTNLTKLTLSGTYYVSNISELSSLTNLYYLDLSGNYCINNISALSNLTNLTELDLKYNNITDWSPVAHVENVLGRPE